jgi:hypothetical protein
MVLKLPPVRDGEVYHTVSRPGQARPHLPFPSSCAALTPYGLCGVSRTGQAGTRCGLGRRQKGTAEGSCTGGSEEVVRGPFGGSSRKATCSAPLMVLTLELMGQVIPLNFHRFERLLIPARRRCSSFTMSIWYSPTPILTGAVLPQRTRASSRRV